MFNWEKNLERIADAAERISGVLERADDFMESLKNLAPVIERIEALEKYTPTIDVLVDWMREVTEKELLKHLCPTCTLEKGCGTSHVATCNITKCEGYKPPVKDILVAVNNPRIYGQEFYCCPDCNEDVVDCQCPKEHDPPIDLVDGEGRKKSRRR